MSHQTFRGYSSLRSWQGGGGCFIHNSDMHITPFGGLLARPKNPVAARFAGGTTSHMMTLRALVYQEAQKLTLITVTADLPSLLCASKSRMAFSLEYLFPSPGFIFSTNCCFFSFCFCFARWRFFFSLRALFLSVSVRSEAPVNSPFCFSCEPRSRPYSAEFFKLSIVHAHLFRVEDGRFTFSVKK